MRGTLSYTALALLVGAACASSKPVVRMVGSPEVPSAQGTVTATSTSNNNTAIDIDVRHLASPELVHPGATTYIVWARPTNSQDYQNLGALRVDRDLRGRLRTVTPLRSFDVMITAEDSPTAIAPTTRRVLSASIQR